MCPGCGGGGGGYVVKIKSSTSKGSVFMRVLGILEVVGGSRLSEHFRAG